MKKILIITLLIFLLFGCTPQDIDLEVKKDNITILNLNDTIEVDPLSSKWESLNEDIVKVEEDKIVAIGEGLAKLKRTINKKEQTMTIYVRGFVSDIIIEGSNNLDVGETDKLSATVIPVLIDQKVSYRSSDENIVSVDNEGNIEAINIGLATIYVTSTKDNFVKEHLVLVERSGIELIDLIENKLINKEESISSLSAYFKPIIDTASESVIGVSNYKLVDNKLTNQLIGSGIIYKRFSILEDGSISSNNELTNITGFKYYVITNRNVIKNADVLKIYYDEDVAEINAEIVQFDDKVDLALLTFTSRAYFPVAKFGDSDSIQTGEFIFAIGHSLGYDYFRTVSMGIISYPTRYMSDDTDNDGINDWDALYIQHDASINNGNNGGPIVNLKGEVIGINTLKLTSINIDNSGFAIPINFAFDILEILEQGKKPQRAILNVTVVDVKAILMYPDIYPLYTIPEGIDYGFYITEVNPGGIAYNSGMKKGDILLKYNEVEMRYSHILRTEINKFLMGSKVEIIATVYRDNQFVDLVVVY